MMPRLHDHELDDILNEEPDPTLAQRVRRLSQRLAPARHRSPPQEPALAGECEDSP